MSDARFGLTERQVQLVEELLVRPLREWDPELRIWVFGSRAKGTNQRYSDLDVLVESSHAPVPRKLLERIEDELEESDLTIEVDLVADERLAPEYRASVLSERVPWEG